jgi:predicted small lipoprotein YifL
MKNTFIVIFIGLLVLSGCGQTGPLKLAKKLPEKNISTQQEFKPEVEQQTNVKLKKTS